MRVATKYARDPLFVVCIYVPLLPDLKGSGKNEPLLMVAEGNGLIAVREAECEFIDRRVDDFVLLDTGVFDNRFATLMWRPLAESGLYKDLMEFDPGAGQELKRLMAKVGSDRA